MVGVRPSLEIIEFEPFRSWAERGSWRGVEATLRLRFTGTRDGCRVVAERRGVRAPGLYAVAATALGAAGRTRRSPPTSARPATGSRSAAEE